MAEPTTPRSVVRGEYELRELAYQIDLMSPEGIRARCAEIVHDLAHRIVRLSLREETGAWAVGQAPEKVLIAQLDLRLGEDSCARELSDHGHELLRSALNKVAGEIDTPPEFGAKWERPGAEIDFEMEIGQCPQRGGRVVWVWASAAR